MGNCICVKGDQTTSSWSEDNKRSRRSTVFHVDGGDEGEEEEEMLLGETSNETSSFYGKKEIKIRMTKKELENLMKSINLKCLTAEEILSNLLIHGHGGDDDQLTNHHRSWRPALQSIPEID